MIKYTQERIIIFLLPGSGRRAKPSHIPFTTTFLGRWPNTTQTSLLDQRRIGRVFYELSDQFVRFGRQNSAEESHSAAKSETVTVTRHILSLGKTWLWCWTCLRCRWCWFRCCRIFWRNVCVVERFAFDVWDREKWSGTWHEAWNNYNQWSKNNRPILNRLYLILNLLVVRFL